MLKALLFAGLLAAFCHRAGAQSAHSAQSTQSGQPILFTSPDGQTVSNALLPAIQAPGTQELPDSQQAGSISMPQLPAQQWGLSPRSIPVSRESSDASDDLRKRFGVETPSEMMGVPTMREMFGLPKIEATNSISRDAFTNDLSGDGQLQSDDANWARILSADSEAFNSTRTASSNSMSRGFFDSLSGDRLFQEKSSDDLFGSPQQAQAPSDQNEWNAAVQIAAPEGTPGAAPEISPMSSAFHDSSASSLSPFTLPASDTLGAMPHLPALPSLPGQNNAPAQVATPSWAPKPPPWLAPMPPMGTMAQRKF